MPGLCLMAIEDNASRVGEADCRSYKLKDLDYCLYHEMKCYVEMLERALDWPIQVKIIEPVPPRKYTDRPPVQGYDGYDG